MTQDASAPAAPAADPDCVFCGIVAGTVPADLVHADDTVVAFRDLAPKAPVHVLVVPREHRRDVRELAAVPETLAHLVDVAGQIAADLADGDFRLVFNTGENAGQTVLHVHAHVLAGIAQTESDTGEL
ncbi:HIT domain-containing protein [Brachybacterium sp. AOP25-B2-12]|uniref:HIT domain-containing protein n=1 Tax=Brachybacterium sp. AOP25-B2-12 TaxID=3457710 RepID=UPI00403317C1